MPWQQVCAHQPEHCPHSTTALSPGCCPQGAAHPPPLATKSSFRQPPGMLQELGVPVPQACPCHGVPSTAARCFPPQGFISTTSAFWQQPWPAPQGTKTGQIMEKKWRKRFPTCWVVPALPQSGSLPLAALLFPRDDTGYHSRIHISRGHRTNDLYLSPRLKITSHQYIHFYTHSFI